MTYDGWCESPNERSRWEAAERQREYNNAEKARVEVPLPRCRLCNDLVEDGIVEKGVYTHTVCEKNLKECAKCHLRTVFKDKCTDPQCGFQPTIVCCEQCRRFSRNMTIRNGVSLCNLCIAPPAPPAVVPSAPPPYEPPTPSVVTKTSS